MRTMFFAVACVALMSSQAFAWYSYPCEEVQERYGFFTGRPDMMRACKVGEENEWKFKETYQWSVFGMIECDSKTGWILPTGKKGESCLFIDTLSIDRFCEWMTRSERKFKVDNVWINLRYVDFSGIYSDAGLEKHLASYCHDKFNVTFEAMPTPALKLKPTTLTRTECVEMCMRGDPELFNECLDNCSVL